MQIFDKRNDSSYRRKPACGYCREEGHNRYQCPRVAEDWFYLQDKIIPVRQTNLGHHYFKQPRYWGDWWETCRYLNLEQQARKKAKKTTRKRAASKCGFCRGEGHSRRNCPEQKAFLAKCYKANENWRRAAYKEIVEKHGICVGACIEVKKKQGWASDSPILTEIGIIAKVNFDNLNVLAAMDGYYHGHGNPYYCSLAVSALVGEDGEQNIMIRVSNRRHGADFKAIELDFNIIRRTTSGYYNGYTMSKLVSPSEHPLDEKWVTDYRDAFDFLTKKRTKKQLDNDGITSLINKWANKS